MRMLTVLFHRILVFVSALSVNINSRHLFQTNTVVDPEISENITEILKSNGYHVEEHYVVTEDLYILCLLRLRKPELMHGVVYMQHGLLDSAHTWVMNLKNQSLGFMLADAGYDVWLGNSRGSTYSRKHVKLSPGTRLYWDFSWDEMAKYDLPASLYYVLNYTKAVSLAYVGHSQGCQIALAEFSRNPDLQSRISVFIALAPVAYLRHVESPIKLLVPVAQKMEYLLKLFNHGEFLPNSDLITFLGKFLCSEGHASIVCKNIIYLIAGYDAANTNTTRLPVYLAHTPAGTSTKNVVHYCQGIASGKFQQYDYGWLRNVFVYGQRDPPQFNLSKITVPSAIFYGGHDWLAVENDIVSLANEIKTVLLGMWYLEHYNHLDFVWGMDAGYVLYPTVLDILQRH